MHQTSVLCTQLKIKGNMKGAIFLWHVSFVAKECKGKTFFIF